MSTSSRLLAGVLAAALLAVDESGNPRRARQLRKPPTDRKKKAKAKAAKKARKRNRR